MKKLNESVSRAHSSTVVKFGYWILNPTRLIFGTFKRPLDKQMSEKTWAILQGTVLWMCHQRVQHIVKWKKTQNIAVLIWFPLTFHGLTKTMEGSPCEQIIEWGGSILDPGRKKVLFIALMSPAAEN